MMFSHLLKLIWKRKGRNLMLSAEIGLAFVVVFGVLAFAVRSVQLYRLPVGFQHANVWTVEVNTNGPVEGGITPALLDQLQRGLTTLPEVQKVAFASYSLYEMSRWSTLYSLPSGGKAESYVLNVSDDFFDATSMRLLEGRWFSAADDGQAATPMVINKHMATVLGAGKSALGMEVLSGSDPKEQRRFKVVGVVEEFRNQGEFMSPGNFSLPRIQTRNALSTIVLSLKPDTERAFEVKLNARLKQLHNGWSYKISTLSDQRASTLRTEMIPLVVLSVVASFLLLMVAFGLFGVLWQNTTLRIPEIGLRRAIGAHAGHIYRQIVAEQMLLSSVAMAVALLLLVQLPITGVFGDFLNWPVFLTAAALSMAVIYLLSLVCALYPGWRASRLSPTEALHYE